MERAAKSDRSLLTLKSSQTQLARIVGLNPVHLNRVLRDLSEKGLITTDAGTIGLTNFSRLSDLARFEFTYLLRPRPTACLRGQRASTTLTRLNDAGSAHYRTLAPESDELGS